MKFRLMIVCCLFAHYCFAQQNQQLRREFLFTSENDAFLFQIKDAYYTNGVFINFRIADTSSTRKKIHSFAIGQKIFTPVSKKAETVNEIDRPYCGYLFVRYSQLNSYKNDALFQWGSSLGVVGNASLGEALQNSYHKLLGFKRFEGWKYQVRNAIGIDFNASYSQTLFNVQDMVKLVPLAEATLGTHFTNARAGAILCIGSYESNKSSVLFNTRVSSGYAAPKKKMELFAYAYPSVLLQVYNASLQGGLFSKGNGAVLAQPEKWVIEQRWGICFAKNRFSSRLEFTHQSRETASQLRAQSYGSFQVGVRMF